MRKIADPLGHLLARAERVGDCLVLPGRDMGKYGTMKFQGRTVKIHRFVYEQEHGPTPLNICHTCDVPGCFAIEHLFAGTQADNMLDMYAKGRRPEGIYTGRPMSGAANPNWKGGVSADHAEYMRRWRIS